jgi:hypothetical protein
MSSSLARFLALPLFLSAIICCGGSTSGTSNRDGGISADGGPGASCPINLAGTPNGRPVAMMCAASTNLPGLPPDGGVTSCTTDADCGTSTLYRWCRAGKCQVDQCFTDGDCGSGEACLCANEQVGNALHTNSCVQTQCHVDSDCGSGEVCSPTVMDLCSDGAPFFACHSSADKCRVDADCCSSAPACRYQPMVGHWECVARCTVSG